MTTDVKAGLINWSGMESYAPKNVFAILIERPDRLSLFQDVASLNKYYAALKITLEQHPVAITGLATGFKTDMESRTLVPTPITPVFEINEVFGKAVDRLFTSLALIASKTRNVLSDMHECQAVEFDLLFIEPDPTHSIVADAWLLKRAYVSEVQGPDASRDIRVIREKDKSYPLFVTFGGRTLRDQSVIDFAQEKLNTISLVSSDPNVRSSIMEKPSRPMVPLDAYDTNKL